MCSCQAMPVKKIARFLSPLFLSAVLMAASQVAAGDASVTQSPANDQPLRIISASPTVTELFIALDAQENLIAIDNSSMVHLSPEMDIPNIGYYRQIGAEGLLALDPTHLIGSVEMGPQSSITLLRAAGIDVTAYPEDNSIDAMMNKIETLGELTKHQNEAQRLKQQITAKLDNLASQQPAKKPKMLFVMLTKGKPITVAGSGTTVNQVIHLAGAINPAEKNIDYYKPLSAEAIVKMQPDYLLMSKRTLSQLTGSDTSNADVSVDNAIAALVKSQPLLVATPAIEHKQIIAIEGYQILGGFGLASLELATQVNQQLTAPQPQ